MPVTKLSQQDMHQLMDALIRSNDLSTADALLQDCHEFHTYGSLQTYERFFRKDLEYKGFEVHIPYVQIENEKILEADIQFKRKSEFPAPYLNRNKKLINELDNLLSEYFNGMRIKPFKVDGFRKFQYGSELSNPNESTSVKLYFECTLLDEPHSSGQTDPNHTKIRNDFVIIRYVGENTTQ